MEDIRDENETLRLLQEESKKGRGSSVLTSADLESTLHRACENGWLEVTQLLLQTFSLDPNTLDYQRTNLRPLHLAARGGHEELVQSLISKGATVDSEDFTGSTALHYSMKEGKWRTSLSLVKQYNANLLKCNGSGEVPLLLGLERALQEEEEKAFHSILELYDAIPLPCSIQYPIIKATYDREWKEDLLYLLRIDEKKSKGKTLTHFPLLLSVTANGDQDITSFLLDHNADYSIIDESGNTALHHAVSEGHFDCVRLLLKRAPSLVSMCNNRGEGVVRFAVWARSFEMMQMLVEGGAEPDQEDEKGETPLLSAIRQDSRGIAEHLVRDLQCDVTRVNKKGDSILSSELMGALQDRNANKALWLLSLTLVTAKSLSKDCLYLACQQGMVTIMDVLLQVCHCDPLQLSPVSGLTPYHIAVKARNVPVLQRLLAYKTCPLQLAAANGITVAGMAKECPGATKLLELGRKQSLLFAQKVVKIFILGDDSTGKSSLAHAIKVSSKGIGGRRGTMRKREPTLGIKVRKVELVEAGPVLIYDCPASLRHQRPSVLKKLASGGYPSLFIIVTDIRQSKAEAGENVSSWASFINSICMKGSYVIVAGSHVDESSMSQWGFQDSSSISESCTNLIGGGGVMLDTRSVRSRQADDLLSILAQSVASLRSASTSRPLQFQHLALYVFLAERMSNSTISLPVSELMTIIEGDSYYHDIDLSIKESLSILEDKGLVLVLEDNDSDQSILVLQPYLLMDRVLNATVTCSFGDDGFIEEKAFLQSLHGLNPLIIIPFLCKFSLCLKLLLPPAATSTQVPILFFPSRVLRESPNPEFTGSIFSSNDSYHFGWFMQTEEQFSSDILHAIQMEIVTLHSSRASYDSESVTQSAYHVWSRGIYCSREGVQAIVELQDYEQQVSLLMTCQPGDQIKLVKQRSQLLAMLHRVACNISNKTEYVLSPVHLQSYPLNADTELVTYDVSAIADALSEKRGSISGDEGTISIKDLLHFDSYLYFPTPSALGTSSVTSEEEKLSYIEYFLAQSSVPENDSVLVTMIATQILNLSDEAVTEVMTSASDTDIILCLFKRWAQNLPYSNFEKALKEALNQFSIHNDY